MDNDPWDIESLGDAVEQIVERLHTLNLVVTHIVRVLEREGVNFNLNDNKPTIN
jgi:hypothetical protein